MAKPSKGQIRYLSRGLDQPGGKLPLFDDDGQEIDVRTIHACVKAGWAKPWFANPLKPDWLVCRLTDRGREITQKYSQEPSTGRGKAKSLGAN